MGLSSFLLRFGGVITNTDNSSNNGGIFSRFRERLRKIRIARSKKNEHQDEFVKEKVKEIRKEVHKDNTIYKKKVVGIDNTPSKSRGNNKVDSVIVDIRNTKVDRNYLKKKAGIGNNDKVKVVKIKDGNGRFKGKDKLTNKVYKDNLEDKVKYIRDNKPNISRKRVGVDYSYKEKKLDIDNLTNNEKEKLVKVMKADIIDKLKTSFEDRLDELSVIESELMIVNQKQDEAIELKKVKELKEKINELISKINDIVEEYNIYKKNYYIDNVIGIDDNIIIDDIISYRRLIDSLNDEKKFVKEYKGLGEFKELYNSLDNIKKKTEVIRENNEEKMEKFNVRDKKYNDIKLRMVNVKEFNNNCNKEIVKQNKYFKDLMEKVSKIEREEYLTYHMNGMGNLIGQTLKYMGLMMISPFAGLIPSIAIQTIATKKMIGNIYKNIHPEEVKHVKYSAINYDNEINKYLTDIGYTENLLNDTLSDIKRLKEDFLFIYNSNLPGYEDTLNNICNVEKMIIHNQNRVDLVKKNLKKSKKLNNNKLALVKKLNN